MIAHAHDFIAVAQPRNGGGAVGTYQAHDRLDRLGTDHREHRIQQNRKQQVHAGSGDQHRDPVRDRTTRERAVDFGGVDRALALIKELHIPAQGDCGDAVFRVVGAAPLAQHQRPTEADAKAQDLEAELFSDPVVTEFVYGHQDADGDQKSGGKYQNSHAEPNPFMQRPAAQYLSKPPPHGAPRRLPRVHHPGPRPGPM